MVADTAMRRGPSHVGLRLLGLVFGLAHDDSCKLKVLQTKWLLLWGNELQEKVLVLGTGGSAMALNPKNRTFGQAIGPGRCMGILHEAPREGDSPGSYLKQTQGCIDYWGDRLFFASDRWASGQGWEKRWTREFTNHPRLHRANLTCDALFMRLSCS